MNSLGALLALTRGYRTSYGIAIAGLMCGTALFLLLPQELGIFLEDLSKTGGVNELKICLRVSFILMIQAVIMAGYSYIVASTAERIGNQLRERYFSTLLASDIVQTKMRQGGEIASEFSSDISIIQSGLSDVLIASLRHITFVIGAVTAIFLIDGELALITLTSVLITGLIMLLLIRRATASSLAVQVARGQVLSRLIECTNNLFIIQTFSRERWFFDKFIETNEVAYKYIRQQSLMIAVVNPVSMLFFMSALLTIVVAGVHRIRVGAITSAELLSTLTYALILVSAVSQVGLSFGRLHQSAELLNKHKNKLASISTIPDMEPAQSIEKGPINVVLNSVSYTYPGSKRPAIRDIGFEVTAGTITALVGNSGSGKSTIVSIIAGAIRPDCGNFNFGDNEPQFKRIAVVPQEPHLFSGTIFDNIAMGRPGINFDDVFRAAQMASIDELITSLADGFDHILAEGGRNLSRGQQQRLALARALADSPGLLILDEATASIDVHSEKLIGNAISALRGKVTVVIVAHQSALLGLADQKIVVNAGSLVAPIVRSSHGDLNIPSTVKFNIG
ncbi:ABC transporter ATP-binding protein [Gluconobacter sp. GP1]|uniref:ABC transporter ATP-binding protein n=1 Tax=Gluconobacter sp. GP1 TaxID=3046423 RepID=UPI00293E5231|nr:ABC transporter ATP-binding protein [Gluconobacter sp. GP1]